MLGDINAAFLLFISFAGGTTGYMIIEDYSLADAFYMTVITISTVGYGEVVPLSQSGRIFTSLLILYNLGVVAYGVSMFTTYMASGQLFISIKKAQMEKQIEALSDHIVICGYSRYAEESIIHFIKFAQPLVLIEREEDKIELFRKKHPDLPYVIGDGSDDEVLVSANILKAKALICAISDDSENVFITMTARQLNPNLNIIARTANNKTERKLEMAGANHIIMPERIGGFYMATLVNKPGTVEFFTQITNEFESDVRIEEICYEDVKDSLKDKTIAEMDILQKTGANIIGFKFGVHEYIVNPQPSTVLSVGTSLVALGSAQQINGLVEYCK